MKLSQIDSEWDQNDIETQYLWNISSWDYLERLFRIDLRSLKIDFSFSESDLSQIQVTNWIALPNNQIFGRYEEERQNRSHLFIADENGNIKIIKSTSLSSSIYGSFASCYYDDSIFIFDEGRHAERYLIAQNRWIGLTDFPTLVFGRRICIGFNQKMIISKIDDCQFWVYDIILDSYSDNLSLRISGEVMFKDSGKIYSLSCSYYNSIHYCFNPFEKWRCVKNYDRLLVEIDYNPSAYFNRSIYYLRKGALYEFSLKTYKSKVTKVVCRNSRIKRIKN